MFQKPFITVKRCLVLWQCWLCCPYLLLCKAGPLMCHVQEGAMNRGPKFGSFCANMKIIDDTNQSKRFDWLVHFPYIFQSFSGTGDLPQPTTEPSYTDQHCHLLFSQFSSWQKCFLPRVINGDCWDLPHFGVKVCQDRAKAPSYPWQSRTGCCSCRSLLPLLCGVCGISQCCRAFLASCLNAAGVATSFARLVTRPASHYSSCPFPHSILRALNFLMTPISVLLFGPMVKWGQREINADENHSKKKKIRNC